MLARLLRDLAAAPILPFAAAADATFRKMGLSTDWTDGPRGREATRNGAPGATKKPVDAPVRIAGQLDRFTPTHHEWT